ncbi:DEAD/DEAH box helicase [Candidatus Cardinium hertigii]|uniref:DEAD/DEAH box helicase n=1 Tax=Candidatus Cardinium hertigii TaxID=247481 RepID=UPI003D7F1447
MIEKVVEVTKLLKDFKPLSDFIKFISDHKFSISDISSTLCSEEILDGASCLNNCRVVLSTRLINARFKSLFPDHVGLLDNQLPTFFRYACPVDTLGPFKKLLSSLHTALSSPPSSSNGFPSSLQSIQVDTDINESIVKYFIKCFNLLYEYKVDSPTAIEAFSFMDSHLYEPSIWESTIHSSVISSSFKGVKQYTRRELIDQIKSMSPNVDFVSDIDSLDSSVQEVMDTYNGLSSILPGSPICKWSSGRIHEWSSRMKGSASVPDKEIIAVIFHAVHLEHKYFPRETQLLSLLILANPLKGFGRLLQVNTGEGKSVIIAMLAAFYALKGRSVDVVTTSTELTITEVNRQKGFFSMLNVSVGENSRENAKSQELIKQVYKKDVVYGTPIDFQGDILRTEFSGMDIRSNRTCDLCIVDEVDSLLYDERKNSTRLTSPLPGMNHLSIVLSYIWFEMDRIYNRTIHEDGKDYYIKFKKTLLQITIRRKIFQIPTILLAQMV